MKKKHFGAAKMKKTYLELLRIFAIILVVFNHTRTLGYSLYQNTESGLSYWLSLPMSIFCKISVPIFFMISGAVLLSKQESIKDLFKKRILRIVFVILIFTFLQYLRILRINPDSEFSLLTYLAYCYSGNIIEPYWYLKSYLGMLFIMPFLRLLVSVMKKEHYLYLIGVKCVTTIIAFGYIYSGYTANVTFLFENDIIFYPLIGYYLANVVEMEKSGIWVKKRVTGPVLVGVLTCVTLLAHVYFESQGQYTEVFHSVATWILAMVFFVFAKGIQLKSELWQKIIVAIGSCTFGVYLIEDVVRNQFEFLVPVLSGYIGEFFACIVFVLASVLTGTVAIYIVKKIPCVKKLI